MKNILKNLKTKDFETENGVNIHERIQNDQTFLFPNREKAEEHAKKSNSYPYPVFENGISNGFFAVPK